MLSCDYDYDVDGFNATKTVRAAKEHKCCECGGKIQKGERHEVNSGVWDGVPYRTRTCPDCAALICDLKRSVTGSCSGWTLGGLRDQLECLSDLVDSKFTIEQARRLLAAYRATAPSRGSLPVTAPWAEVDDA